jgi:hypothetical protein
MTHELIAEGTGHFSRGKCAGCSWAVKGHIDEVHRLFEKYHQGEITLELPERITIPAPTGDPVVDRLEQRLIQLVASSIVYGHPAHQHVARGHAEARSVLLSQPITTSLEYMADMVGKVANLPTRQQTRLMSPGVTRIQMQAILDGTPNV